MLFNLGLAILISAVTQNSDDMKHKMTFHSFLRSHTQLAIEVRRRLKPIAWIITLTWFCFAIGPGAVIGNTIFGDPNDSTTWVFGMPSIWAWQLLWWALGVFMMWFLAYKMGMSTVPDKEIEVLYEDIGDVDSVDLDR